MTKEFLKEKNLEEVAKQFDQELDEFKEKVNGLATQKELEDLEQEVIKEQDEVNDYIKTVKYQLDTKVTFEDKSYTLSEIATHIVYFLNKKTVEWKYTLGLHQLVRFWKSQYKNLEIEYATYDSTLRTLNTISFTGDSDWTAILACNEFFRTAHDAYSKDTSWLIFESEKHNMILDRMKQLEALNSEIEPVEGKQA